MIEQRKFTPENYGIYKKTDFDYMPIQNELEKAKPYLKLPWQMKQNNDFDKKTGIIYDINTFEELQSYYELIKQTCPDIPFGYMLNRWYNHKASTTVEKIFCSYSIVEAERNTKHKKKDFFIFGVPFDLKLSVMPKELYNLDPTSFRKRGENKNKLIEWLYKEQSKEGRFHTDNRLFVVCRGTVSGKSNLESKELKSRFDVIEEKIQNYLLYLAILRERNFRTAFNKLNIQIGNEQYNVLSDAIIIHS